MIATMQISTHKTLIKKFHICISNTAAVVLLLVTKPNLAVSHNTIWKIQNQKNPRH